MAAFLCLGQRQFGQFNRLVHAYLHRGWPGQPSVSSSVVMSVVQTYKHGVLFLALTTKKRISLKHRWRSLLIVTRAAVQEQDRHAIGRAAFFNVDEMTIADRHLAHQARATGGKENFGRQSNLD